MEIADKNVTVMVTMSENELEAFASAVVKKTLAELSRQPEQPEQPEQPAAPASGKRRWLTINQTLSRLNISSTTLDRWRIKGYIKARGFGYGVRFASDEVDRVKAITKRKGNRTWYKG